MLFLGCAWIREVGTGLNGTPEKPGCRGQTFSVQDLGQQNWVFSLGWCMRNASGVYGAVETPLMSPFPSLLGEGVQIHCCPEMYRFMGGPVCTIPKSVSQVHMYDPKKPPSIAYMLEKSVGVSFESSYRNKRQNKSISAAAILPCVHGFMCFHMDLAQMHCATPYLLCIRSCQNAARCPP